MLTPIETRYKGVTFRSRLEARWAVFFDELGIAWTYENEGYVLRDGTRYVPDFWLPTFNGGMWVEVKPKGGDFTKAEKLADECEHDVWFAEGMPSTDFQRYRFRPWNTDDWGLPNWGDTNCEDRMFFGADVECGVGAEDGERPPQPALELFGPDYRIPRAVETATKYRFEY